MIYLHEDYTDYFILVDGQGGTFGGYRIFEGIGELIKQFQEWAEADGYEDPTLFRWTVGECLENWVFELKQYNGTDFVEATPRVLDYKITKWISRGHL